jgi:sugar lactone lactonase YvrE
MEVIITGNNFNTTATNDTVKFSGIAANVKSATATQLTVSVPAGATPGRITVTVKGKTGISSEDFVTIGSVTTFAGNGTAGFADGIGTSAQFTAVSDLVVDKSGNIYVADVDNYRIRKITSAGEVSTFAGSGKYGFVDGKGTEAQFTGIFGLALDAAGNLYVADRQNYAIRKVTPSGEVTTLAGTGWAGYVDGPVATAQFSDPVGIAVDDSGNVYVAEPLTLIRKISTNGIVSTVAGKGGYPGFADGIGINAQFNKPVNIKIDKEGNLIVADQSNNRIRKVTPAGVVTTIAGSGTWGYQDGDAMNAQFRSPAGIGVDEFNNIYIAEYGSIRKLSPDGLVSTVAGSSGDFGWLDGDTKTARFTFGDFCGLGILSPGIIYVTDRGNNVIRKIVF